MGDRKDVEECPAVRRVKSSPLRCKERIALGEPITHSGRNPGSHCHQQNFVRVRAVQRRVLVAVGVACAVVPASGKPLPGSGGSGTGAGEPDPGARDPAVRRSLPLSRSSRLREAAQRPLSAQRRLGAALTLDPRCPASSSLGPAALQSGSDPPALKAIPAGLRPRSGGARRSKRARWPSPPRRARDTEGARASGLAVTISPSGVRWGTPFPKAAIIRRVLFISASSRVRSYLQFILFGNKICLFDYFRKQRNP